MPDEPDFGAEGMLMQQLIETTKSPDVLGVCPESARRGLPSWVTGWSVPSSFTTPLTRDSLDRPQHQHATSGTVAEVGFPPDVVTLVLRGHEVTRVKAVSEPLGRVHFTIASKPPFAEREAIRTRVKKAYKRGTRATACPGGLFSYTA